MKSYYLVAVFLVGVFILSACGPSGGALDPNQVSTVVAQTLQAQNPTQVVVQPTSSVADSYQPVNNSVCTSVQQSLQTLYPTASFTVAIQPFADISGVSGSACVISSFGTDLDFASDVDRVIGTTLPGYIQDAMYAASGATSSTYGYRNGNSLAVVSVKWDPSPSANCPADQPASTCNLQPGDKLYTISVSMASIGAPVANSVPSSVAPTTAPVAAPTIAPTTAPAANSVCDKAEFVDDVTVPDGTAFSRGDNFEKTWKIKNIGTCAWSTGYFIQYENGPLQPKNPKIYINANVAPSQTVDITAAYNVALDPGTYRSNWSLRNSSGVLVPLGKDNTLYTEIKVKASSVAATATATVPAPVGKIVGVTPVITFESGSDLQVCGEFATYTVTFWVSTDGPGQTNYEIIVSDISGFAANGSFVGHGGETVKGIWAFPAAVAGLSDLTLRIEGPYQDPTGITVRVKTSGQTWPPVTVTCQ